MNNPEIFPYVLSGTIVFVLVAIFAQLVKRYWREGMYLKCVGSAFATCILSFVGIILYRKTLIQA